MTAKAKKKVKKKATLNGRLVVEYVPIDSLKPWAKNPRLNDETVDSIVKSIEKFGYTNPVLVRRADNRIIAGHTRVKALKQIGETVAPVIFMDIGKTDADLYALFDNKSTENTAWDPPKLSELLVDLKDIGADIEITGFSMDEITGYTGRFDVDGTGMPALSDGDKAPFQQMTFTLHDSQAEMVKEALDKAKAAGPFIDSENENSNGNALARIVETYLGQG